MPSWRAVRTPCPLHVNTLQRAMDKSTPDGIMEYCFEKLPNRAKERLLSHGVLSRTRSETWPGTDSAELVTGILMQVTDQEGI